jgi:MYXO-CTERM domain-containing protein
MMLRTWLAGSLALLLSLAGSAGTAHGYCRTVTTQDPAETMCGLCRSDGIPLHWATSQPVYHLNLQGFPGLTTEQVRLAAQQSFAEWEAVECNGAPVGFSFWEGAQTPARGKVGEGSTPLANTNVIAYLTADEWRAAGMSPEAYAITGVWFAKSSGEIVGADILFNGTMGPYALCPDSGCPDDAAVDLRNVLTHEIGHFVGLAHSDVPESTMACNAMRSDVDKRTLSDDDRAGLCAAYPDVVQFDRDLRFGGGATCSLDPKRDAGLFAPLALALALSRRRRKRRE